MEGAIDVKVAIDEMKRAGMHRHIRSDEPEAGSRTTRFCKSPLCKVDPLDTIYEKREQHAERLSEGA